jgi:hypothetical protein
MGRRKRSGTDREGTAQCDRKPGRDWAVDENEDPILKTANELNDGTGQTHCRAELRSVVQGNARLQKQCHDEKMRADALKAEVKASMATIRGLQQSHQSMEKTIADLQAENALLRQQVGSLTDKVADVEIDKEALWKNYFAFRYFHRFKLAAKGSSGATKDGGPAANCAIIGGLGCGKQCSQLCAPMEYTTLDEDGRRPDRVEPSSLR